MADVQATDNAADAVPAGETAETTAAGAASATVDPYEARFAAQSQQIDRALKTAEGAARLVHQRDSEIARLRQENARYRQPTQEYGTEQEAPVATAGDPELRTRLQMLEFKQTHPDWRERLAEMQEASSDTVFSERFGNDLGSRATFEAAYEVAENRKMRAELVTLRAAQVKLDEAKKIRKDQAFMSGQGASQPHESIDRAALEKMTPEEMEKKFGKAALSRGYF